MFLLTGIQPAKLLNASWSTCNNVSATRFRVYIHVKVPCLKLLENRLTEQSRHYNTRTLDSGHAYHVFDVVDATYNKDYLWDLRYSMDAIVMSSHEDLRTNCRSRHCVRIPHHYNLKCTEHQPLQVNMSDRKLIIGIVGTLKHYGQDFLRQESEFLKHNLLLKRESLYKKPCKFFNDIDIALAWTNPKHMTKRDLIRKPAERFTNPIVLNIPTIGTSELASFRIAGSEPFLTSDPNGVLPMAIKILRGELTAEFSVLRKNVLMDVDPVRILAKYQSLLFDLTKRSPLSAEAGRVPPQPIHTSMRSSGKIDRLRKNPH